MWVIRFAINNPVKVTVGVILLIMFGLISLVRVPVQLTPNVDQPMVTVTTTWTGASPQEIEREVIERQEEKLKNVGDLRKMTATAIRGRGTVTLEFFVGVDKDTALREVSDRLRQVTGYPIEVDEPVIEASDTALANPIAWLILSSGDPDLDISTVYDFAKDNIKPFLERVPGVAAVDIYGGREREVQVVVRPMDLCSRKLTFQDLERALRGQNLDSSAGTVAEGKRDYTIRTIGQYEQIEQVEDTVIAYRDGGPVFVKDVADVRIAYEKRTAFVRSLGQSVLAMPVRRETGANVITVMAGLKRAIRNINDHILPQHPGKLHVRQVYDETVYIKSAIDLVLQNLYIGGALAVIVLVLFLRSASATGVVAVSIPISIIGTFLGITLLGRTLNVISLAGLAFAVGMVVDNAIVVLENIYRHRQMGKPAAQAALDGAREVWGAVLASTLTTVAVFLPIVFVQEEAGQLFRDIALAIVVAVMLSLIVAVTVIPTLSARALRLGRADRLAVKFGGEQAGGRIARWISGTVYAINRSVPGRILVVAGLTGLAVGGSVLLIPPRDYLPAGNRNLVFGFLLMPPGYSIDEFEQMGHVIEDQLRPYWEAKPGSPEAAALPPVPFMIGNQAKRPPQPSDKKAPAGGAGPRPPAAPKVVMVPAAPIENFFFVGFRGQCFMGAMSKDPERVTPLVKELTAAGAKIPGAIPIFFQTSLFGRAIGGGGSIELEISGNDLDHITGAALMLMGKCLGAFGPASTRPDPPNFALGAPEYRVVPIRQRAADLGLTTRDVAFVIQACVDGAFVGEFRDRGDKIDLKLLVKDMNQRPTQDIAEVPIYTPAGEVVPLISVAQFVHTTAPQQINRIEELRSVTLTVTPPKGMALETAMSKIEQEMVTPLRQAGVIAPDVQINLAGNASKLVEMFETLKWDLLLAVVITYLLMAALFESFIYPFVIMFSVPLAAVGGFAGLRIVHHLSLLDPVKPTQQMDVLTMLGFVILIGVVVNNAILIVHQALNNIRDGGMAPAEAIRESVRSRIRPIFMSSFTSVFGMLPLVIMPGAGSELYRGLGSVVVGGLFVSTIFTLVLVPCLLSLAMGAWSRLRRVIKKPAEPVGGVPAVEPVGSKD